MTQRESIRQKALQDILEVSQRRHQHNERLDALLQTFTTRLYVGFEEAIAMAVEAGAMGLKPPRTMPHPGGGWRQVLQIPIDDWRIVVVPLAGYAWPNQRDEAMIHSSAFKEPAARLAFFLMQHDDPAATSFYDVIILLNASWFAWGYGWPKQQDDVESTDFTTLALDMLASFVKDIHLTWGAREDTTLQSAMDAKRRAYSFGLPGDE